MKAILVIDFLNNRCDGCPCCRKYEDSWGIVTTSECSASNGRFLDMETYERPSWCPLRPLPSPMEYNDNLWTSSTEEEYYKEGWNRFYETITGEADENHI